MHTALSKLRTAMYAAWDVPEDSFKSSAFPKQSSCILFFTHFHPPMQIYILIMISNIRCCFSSVQSSSVQSLSCVQLFAYCWTAARQASLSVTSYRSLLKLVSTESTMPSNHLILCRPLLRPSIFPSIRVFSNESALPIRWPKYWSFRFNISPSNEYSGLISLRMDWLDLLAVEGTLESSPPPQFKSINSSALSFRYSPTLASIHELEKT